MKLPEKHKFNFDTALRYAPVVNILEKINKKDLKILEVGSGTNGITDFFDGNVVGVDSDFDKTNTEKNSNIQHKKGSIDKLPFSNEEFDVVICLDTFEHIKKDVRKKAVTELLRVAKEGGLIIAGFPSGKLSKKSEEIINSLYKQKTGRDHFWLKEHQDNGLPDEEEIQEILSSLGVKGEKVKVVKNVNLLVWTLIHWFFTVHPNNPISRFLKKVYKLIFSISSINIPPFYRLIFVVKK